MKHTERKNKFVKFPKVNKSEIIIKFHISLNFFASILEIIALSNFMNKIFNDTVSNGFLDFYKIQNVKIQLQNEKIRLI